MKAIISTLGLLVMTSGSAAQAKSNPAELIGQWTIADRVCTDGQATNDGFQLEKDSLELSIEKNSINIDMRVENEIYPSTFSFDATESVMSLTDSRGDVETFEYSFNASNELVLISTGFGSGGTCNEGQSLLSIFKRKQSSNK